MKRWRIGFAVGIVALGTALSATAQGIGGAADTTASYFSRGPGALARLDLSPWLELRLRHDAVADRPGGPDFDRQRATLRAGLSWERPSRPLRIEAGLRASIGSDRNRETWSPFDNETADTVEVDRLGVRVTSLAGDRLSFGKMRLPVPLTELLWDDDLRPVGIAVDSRLGGAGAEGLVVSGGAFQRSCLTSEDVRFYVAQIGCERGNPATRGHEERVSYLGVGNRGQLLTRGLVRQNALPANAIQVFDLQLAGHAHAGRWRVTARLDGALNTATGSDRRAYRTRLAAGGAGAPGGVEAGWIHQRIERESLAGAFNSDDWWFHGRAQGNALFVQAGLGRALSARIVGFRERRDDVSTATRRLVTELRWHGGD
jgi:hypothetical protein